MEIQEFINNASPDFETVEEFRAEFFAWFRRQPNYREELAYEEAKVKPCAGVCHRVP